MVMIVASMDQQSEPCLVNCSKLYPLQTDRLFFVGRLFTCPVSSRLLSCSVDLLSPTGIGAIDRLLPKNCRFAL